MLRAINIDGKSISPYSNEKGFCPLCKTEVIKAVGEINVAHFRHKVLKDCDSWSEGETEWHYNWKQHFPIEWQEKTIERFGELHRADIQTNKGLILELQNSSISSSTIKIRENFYGNMIWLVNAKNFKDNFKIRSIVKEKLREADSDYYQYSNSIFNQKSERIKDLEEKLSDCHYSYNKASSDIDYLFIELKSLVKDEEDFDNTLSQYLKGNYISSMLYEFKSDDRKEIKILNKKIPNLKIELEKSLKLIDYINSFPNCSIKEFSNWKILDFGLINPANYTNCKVIFRDSIDTFFPEIIDIKTAIQFQSYSRTPEKYILIIDLTKRVITENEKVKEVETEIQNCEKEIERLTEIIGQNLSEWITSKKQEILLKIDEKKKDRDDLEKSILFFGNEIEKQTKIENDKQNEESTKAFRAYEKEQISIKVENKGRYSYYWKNKRKTWEFADKPIYLDFGDCIFKITGKYDLVKMKTEDFINFVKNS